MVEIDFKIVITGIVALAAIYITLVLCDHDTSNIGYVIIGIIAWCIGVMLPSPIINNKTGVLRW